MGFISFDSMRARSDAKAARDYLYSQGLKETEGNYALANTGLGNEGRLQQQGLQNQGQLMNTEAQGRLNAQAENQRTKNTIFEKMASGQIGYDASPSQPSALDRYISEQENPFKKLFDERAESYPEAPGTPGMIQKPDKFGRFRLGYGG